MESSTDKQLTLGPNVYRGETVSSLQPGLYLQEPEWTKEGT